jgi:hypothetical protein
MSEKVFKIASRIVGFFGDQETTTGRQMILWNITLAAIILFVVVAMIAHACHR